MACTFASRKAIKHGIKGLKRMSRFLFLFNLSAESRVLASDVLCWRLFLRHQRHLAGLGLQPLPAILRGYKLRLMWAKTSRRGIAFVFRVEASARHKIGLFHGQVLREIPCPCGLELSPKLCLHVTAMHVGVIMLHQHSCISIQMRVRPLHPS